MKKARTVWFAQLVGNAGIAASVYLWLGIPDRTTTHLVLSALTALVIFTFAAWFHGSTIAFFRTLHETGDSRFIRSLRATLRHLPALTIWLMVVTILIWLVFQIDAAYRQPVSTWISSALTLRLRRPVSPQTVGALFSSAVTVTALMIVPVLLLPFGREVAAEGFGGLRRHGFVRALTTLRRLRYWLTCVGVFIVCAYIPYRLIWWIPEVGSFNAETASMVARFLGAYLLAVTGWLVLASSVWRMRGDPLR